MTAVGSVSAGDHATFTAGLPAVLDVIVIGGGSAGTAAVFRARELGRRALLIERDELLKRFRERGSEALLDSDDESAGRRRLPKCGELIQALRLSANGTGFELVSAWRDLYRRFEVPFRIDAELVELREGYSSTWRVGVFNRRSETREDLYSKCVVLALGSDADREFLKRIGVLRDIDARQNAVLLSTDLESALRNVYIAGNMLHPAYFECDRFDDDSSRFREVKHDGSIYTSLADGIAVADAIAQRTPRKISVRGTRKDLANAHASSPAVETSARGKGRRRTAPALGAGFAIAIAVSAAVWTFVSWNGAMPASDPVVVNSEAEESAAERQGLESSTGPSAIAAQSLEDTSAETPGADARNGAAAVAEGPSEEPDRRTAASDARSVDELLAAANEAFEAGEFGAARRLFREARESDRPLTSTLEGSPARSVSGATQGATDGALDVDDGGGR